MDTEPQQPSPLPPADDQSTGNAPRRQLRSIWNQSIIDLSAYPSWGERLLPLAFAAMETCWVDAVFIALASISFFQLRDPLMPLWSPFVLIAGAAWFSTYLERRDLTSTQAASTGNRDIVISGSRYVFILLAAVSLFIVWSSIYASSAFVLDPRWLLALLNDLLLLSPNAYHALGIFVLSAYFCWRGVSFSRRLIEPSTIFKALRIGLVIFIAVILVRAGTGKQGFDELQLLLLLPLFLSCALLAHALSKALFVRRSHPIGLSGNIATQEGALLTVIGAVCLILLLLSLVVGTLASPAFLAQVQQALSPIATIYTWLIGILAQILALLLTPLFWLISLLPKGKQPRSIRQPQPAGQIRRPPSNPETILTILAILHIAVPILLTIVVCFLILWALRRRRIALRRRDEDIHESLWSWQLFLLQLQALLRALWLHLFPRKQPTTTTQTSLQEASAIPAIRTIREIYRALLQWAAGRGYPRQKNETPHEFMHRLNHHLPDIEPELTTVTDAYTTVRYGEAVPNETEVARVQAQWATLQQKVQAP